MSIQFQFSPELPDYSNSLYEVKKTLDGLRFDTYRDSVGLATNEAGFLLIVLNNISHIRAIVDSQASPFFSILAFLMVSFSNASFAQAANTQGQCYLSRPYQSGVRDSLVITVKNNQIANLNFKTTYCNYLMSEDCSNARQEDFLVKGKKINEAQIKGVIEGTNCAVDVRFESKEKVFVSQRDKCAAIQFWGPHGIYTLAKNEESSFCKN